MMFGLGVPKDEASSLESFEKHRNQIHSLASRLIREKRFDENGEVIIREADLK